MIRKIFFVTAASCVISLGGFNLLEAAQNPGDSGAPQEKSEQKSPEEVRAVEEQKADIRRLADELLKDPYDWEKVREWCSKSDFIKSLGMEAELSERGISLSDRFVSNVAYVFNGKILKAETSLDELIQIVTSESEKIANLEEHSVWEKDLPIISGKNFMNINGMISLYKQLLKEAFGGNRSVPGLKDFIRKHKIGSFNIFSLKDPTLGLTQDQAKEMYKALSIYDAVFDETTAEEKMALVKEKGYDKNIVLLWSSVAPEGKEAKPTMVTATLLDSEDAEFEKYKNKIAVTCAHFCDYKKIPNEQRFMIADENGNIKMPDGNILKLEPGKERKSRFAAEAPYNDGNFVKYVYFAKNADITFCVFDKPLAGASKGIKLSTLKDSENARDKYVGKEIFTIGYGTGIKIDPYPGWPKAEYKSADSKELINKKEIEFVDELHKAAGWQFAKYKKGKVEIANKIKEKAFGTTSIAINHGDSGSAIMISEDSPKIMGIASGGNIRPLCNFYIVTESMLREFKEKLRSLGGQAVSTPLSDLESAIIHVQNSVSSDNSANSESKAENSTAPGSSDKK